MGTWGTGISSNDVHEDICDTFFGLYNQGLEAPEITQRLITENQNLIESEEDQNNFWIALALCQWECKALDEPIFNRIKTLIESGKDLQTWEESGASKSELKQRKKVLDKFLKKISVEKKNAKKRKRKVLRDAVYAKGTGRTLEKWRFHLFGNPCLLWRTLYFPRTRNLPIPIDNWPGTVFRWDSP